MTPKPGVGTVVGKEKHHVMRKPRPMSDKAKEQLRANKERIRAKVRAQREHEKALQTIEAWNAAHPVGSLVRYWSGERVGGGAVGEVRFPATLLAGRVPVAWVVGYRACIALTHVEGVE